MKLANSMLPLLLVALFMLSGTARSWAVNPTAEDRENYSRLIEILFAGTEDNRKIAKDTLRQMGEVGVKLLKEDCRDITSVRGAFAWSLLKEFLAATDPESLRGFARDEILSVAKEWNRTYTEKDSDSSRPRRLQQLVADFVELLSASPEEKDFEVLLKVLKYSLVIDPKADYGSTEFETWKRIWNRLHDKVKASESLSDVREWQKTVDAHFRYYSQRKVYVNRKTVEAYHTATLVFIHRINQLKEEAEYRRSQEKKEADGTDAPEKKED